MEHNILLKEILEVLKRIESKLDDKQSHFIGRRAFVLNDDGQLTAETYNISSDVIHTNYTPIQSVLTESLHSKINVITPCPKCPTCGK